VRGMQSQRGGARGEGGNTHSVAQCCSVLQPGSVLQCVAVCCSVTHLHSRSSAYHSAHAQMCEGSYTIV